MTKISREPKPAPVPRLTPAPIKASTADVVLAYRQVFGTQEGAIVLADLMRYFAFNMGSMFDPNAKNPTELLQQREGQRSVLVHIGRRMETDPASIEATEQVES